MLIYPTIFKNTAVTHHSFYYSFGLKLFEASVFITVLHQIEIICGYSSKNMYGRAL